jgi:aryl-alcohol dehydrogenase-like predicted oxidoreductase
MVDRLREIATRCGHTVADLVIRWTVQQPGITSALCGAKRPDQIRENANGSGWQLDEKQLAEIDRALAERGAPVAGSPV